MAMTLELNADEAQELGKALETYLGWRSLGTDSWDYRASLKARRNVLSMVLRQVRPGATRG